MGDDTIKTRSTPLAQRLVGLGTIFIGCFTLFCCIVFLGQLMGTPKQTLGLIVTGISVLIVLAGFLIGFPEKLPQAAVAIGISLFGILTMLMGTAIIGWHFYSVIVQQQKAFRPSGPLFAFVIVSAGFAMLKRGLRMRAINQSDG